MFEKEIYMQRALDLAALGKERVSPNPMVGCVIVHNDLIIGEGYHKQFGEDHAEVNAINSVIDKKYLSESDVYVTLEPCAHFGKTPPCVDLLIKSKVSCSKTVNSGNRSNHSVKNWLSVALCRPSFWWTWFKVLTTCVTAV